MKNLTVTRGTQTEGWSFKGKDGTTHSGTQNSQTLYLRDENGNVLNQTTTPIHKLETVVNKVGFIVVRVSDNHIVDKGWTINEKSINRKWFYSFVKEGKYKLLIGRLN